MEFNEVETIAIGKMSDKEVAGAIINYKDKIKQLNDEVDNAKEVYAKLEQELLKRYELDGCTSTTFIDPSGRRRTLYVSRKINPIAKFSYGDQDKSEAFAKMLKNNHMEHLLKRTSGEMMKSARAVFKELFEQLGELPPDMAEFVEVRTDQTINMRSL